MPKTKIISTIGPASNSATIIRKMMRKGMDVVRLNFSHGNHAEHRRCLEIVREINKKYRRRIRILQDLQGHRIRLGGLRGHKPILLKKRETVWLSQKRFRGDRNIIPFDYRGSLRAVKTGARIFIDDGTIELIVTGRRQDALKTVVERGGAVREHKGVNIPGAHLDFPAMARHDIDDIRFGIKYGVDYIAQSFVRDARDVERVKDLIAGRLPRCRVIAKIENREGIRNIDNIIDASDGIMIARGDMGISIPIYEVPLVQKEIIRKCVRKKKFVITATQMLESMTEHFMPTRAEVSDVANAILDGTDFVMLSAETAVGKFPVEAVTMMNQIILYTERGM